jgi:hypothetical protein
MPPRHVLTADEERLVTDAAMCAPSMNSSQPWRIVFAAEHVEVWADPMQASDTDPGVAISCGAASYNACLAVRVGGHESWIQVHPATGENSPVALVHIGVRRVAAEADAAQYESIGVGRAEPGPYRDWRLPFALITRLEEAAEAEGGFFRVLTSSQIERVRDVVDRSTGAPSLSAPNPPTLAVLSTQGDSPREWIRTGMALGRVLLTAHTYGVEASLLRVPVEHLVERAHLSGLALGFDRPQLVLRLGYPSRTVASQRLPRQAVSTGGPGR